MRFYDERARDFVEFRLRAEVRVSAERGLRAEHTLALLRGALEHLGCVMTGAKPPEIHIGDSEPAEGCLWLKPGPGAAAEPLLLLRTRYREPLDASPRALAAAAAERRALQDAARRLAGAGAAPNSTGLSAYKKRFREALADDLDAPAALEALWDALKPGALSPGSQLSFLREADKVLGLGLIPL